ncbi:DEAD/DEAH box helicase [Flagellimonas halotolerans]|uniref:DEAD/DEAH box helicase n=1 Tax=Flagellimonas halotolerans TaxID=3112164 RepID=A0ABU6IR29_9FLAO|nr:MULTISPECIES: DEAD/DEAH box helicase [unclassified Allomuricauda]MEC3965577.1 DEAD/DEAH box helicase [Muricauda sp. SYSU M86414]MEC4265443.1 DEAD/DEAH box helicase [Muricauda sp. SYSU M84420]
MKNAIKNIISSEDIGDVVSFVLDRIYKNGPVSTTDMEILSYLKLYKPDEFKIHQERALNYMGVFYKDVEPQTLKEVVFRQYRRHIIEKFQHTYTPVQASIISEIESNKCFSFSAPTSTGKSYVFMNLIQESVNDIVIVVPSRALINEYYHKLNNLIDDKAVNILTFIDKINTKYTQRNVFIVTPERCRELFRFKEQYHVSTFLFDEAQLSNEDSKRGLYFDSIVRRAQKAFTEASFVFAHPFVSNPESQIKKNHFQPDSSKSVQFKQKNVGQIYLCSDADWNFYHFGIEKSIMGNNRVKCSFDPIVETIRNHGSVLFYVSKSKIYNRGFLNQFKKYINLCTEIEGEKIDSYIDQLKEYTGGNTIANKNYYSQLLALLKRGIVIHHGSLPLQTRLILEKFTQDGLCRICFATSTLEQGVNMPFDVVYLDRLESSKALSVKNLIGRAGRSTSLNEFDFGYVIINSPSKMSAFRGIIEQDEILDEESALEKSEQKDEDYNDFKEAILNDTYSDEFNLTEKDLDKLTSERTEDVIKRILDAVFDNNQIVPLNKLNQDLRNRLQLYSYFRLLYSIYLNRPLGDGEGNVLDTAIKIILWKVHGKTFKNICWYRYSHASKTNERARLEKLGRGTNQITANFITGYHSIPDKNHNVYSLFPPGTRAADVDYDLIMTDTYDFIDKLISFKLTDVFYASFLKYFQKKEDLRAEKLAKYIKYGTDNERHIWMLRYGMSFEDIEKLETHILTINSEEIVFKDSILEVPIEERQSIERFIRIKEK